jgi:CRP-like cAMP-binding protein
MNAPSAIARSLIVQRNTAREVRGRVSSAFTVTRNVAFLVGMAAAGLADVWGVRVMMFGSALLVLIPGALALILPGVGQPAAEWRRMVGLLRAAPSAPKPGAGRLPTFADFDALAIKLPALAGLTPKDKRDLLAQARVVEVPAGAAIVSRGEAGDDVYFILAGRAIAGIAEQGNYRSLETMRAGDFFGEIAALVGTPRTANVVADDATTLLKVPAALFRALMQEPRLSQLVHLKFFERMARTHLGDLPRVATMDQQDLRALRQVTGDK